MRNLTLIERAIGERLPKRNTRDARIKLTPEQAAFASSMALYPGIVAGYGSGKTHALAARAIKLALENIGLLIGYYAPTYKLINLIARPRVIALLSAMGLKFTSIKSDESIYIHGYGTILFRSMDNPDSLIGYETCHTLVDELDTLPKDKAEIIWVMLLARNRQSMEITIEHPDRSGQENTIAIATTPEGFKFVYEHWGKDIPKAEADGFKLYRASSYSNEKNLSKGYIAGLRKNYPPQLFEVYVMGEFVNLTSGSVYGEFKRSLDCNGTNEVIRQREELHIGMDFNVYKMAAVVFTIRNGEPFALDEFTKLRDTPDMCDAIRQRYGHRHPITVYPDPAGAATSSKNASTSDHAILRQAGFGVNAHSAHPLVRDRVAAVNAQICNRAGKRRLRVNPNTCRNFTLSLEQQVYDKHGAPDKTSGLDHCADAGGYFIEKTFPLSGQVAGVGKTRGA